MSLRPAICRRSLRRVGLLLRLDDALCDIAEDTPHALALGDAPELAPITDRDAVDAVAGIAVVGQFEHAVHVVAVREIRPPRKTLAVDVDRRQRQFRAVEPDTSQVGRNRIVARRIGEADVEQQVARLLVVIVERQRDAVVQQPEVDAGVELEGLLPDQAVVGHRIGRGGRVAVVGVERVVAAVGVVQPDPVVARQPVAHARLEHADRTVLGPEPLLADHPSGRCRREIAPAVACGEFRRTVDAHRRGEEVTPAVVVVHTPEIGDQALPRAGTLRIVGDVRSPGVEHGQLIRHGALHPHVEAVEFVEHVFVARHGTQAVPVAERTLVVGIGLEIHAVGLRKALFHGPYVRARRGVVLDIEIAARMAVVVGELPDQAQPVEHLPVEVDRGRRTLDRRPGIVVVIGVVGGRYRRVVGAQRGRARQLLARLLAVPVAVGVRDGEPAYDRVAQAERRALEGLLLDLRIAERRRGPEPPRHLKGRVAVEREARIARRDPDPAVVRIARRGGVLDVVAAPVDADVVILPTCVAEPLALLVVVLEYDDAPRVHRVFDPLVAGGNRFVRPEVTGRPERSGRIARACRLFAAQHRCRIHAAAIPLHERRTHREDVIAGVHQVELRGGRRPGPLPLEYDPGAEVFRTFLRGDEDHAVRRAGTVDARRRGVLEERNGFDVVGIQPGHFADYAVDQHDRVVRLVDRRSAADQEFGVCARCRIGRSDPHAGDASLQGVADRIDGDTLQEMPVEFADGRSHRPARLRAVSDHHHVLEHGFVFLQHDVDGRPRPDAFLPVGIAYV